MDRDTTAPAEPHETAPPGHARRRSQVGADFLPRLASSRRWQRRVGPLAALPGVVRAHGVDPLALLRQCDLPPGALDDSNACIDFTALLDLLDRAARTTGCAHIGLEIGARATLAQLGAVGEALCRGPSLGDALRGFIAHQRACGDGLAAFTLDHGENVEFGIVALWSGLPRPAPFYDTLAAAVAAWVRELSGGAVRPREICLPHRRNADASIHHEHFGCRIAFECNHLALRFSKASLERAVNPAPSRPRPSPARAPALPDEDLVTALYRTLRLMLTAAQPPHSAALEQCLARERTLRRRLAAQGVCYRDVLGQVRYDLARQLLAETRRDASDIAHACAYGDATAFQRAFRRWAGMTPSQWRALHGQRSDGSAQRRLPRLQTPAAGATRGRQTPFEPLQG
jgi:AraC-like DNA-binding protein